MNSRVTLQTSFGAIELELYPDKAPKTVENFLSYVKEGFFDNTIFHRVIKGFMIQAGGFSTNMVHKEGKPPIENEANNGLSNETGTIAMARTAEPHSASSQFFINVNNNSFLDFKNETIQGFGYCVFGKVLKGMDIVMQISEATTQSIHGHQDVPVEDITIQNAAVTTQNNNT